MRVASHSFLLISYVSDQLLSSLDSAILEYKGQHSSQRASPAGSFRSPDNHENVRDVPVETLISYLVAAKRALSSIHHVHRATTLLNEARSTIESTATLVARTKYLRRSLYAQLKILRSVQFELEGNAYVVKQEANVTIKELETTDRRLQDNIQLLKQTAIDHGFKARKPLDENGEELEVDLKNTLFDFVDDQPVITLRQMVRVAEANVNAARSSVDASIRNLEEDLQQVNEVLTDRTATSSSTKSDLQPLGIPKQLKLLERNAHNMAESLESLVQHFDSCVNAIKHTEGAGAAVAKNFTSEELPEGVDVETFQGPTEPMSEEERTEMLHVLRNDADQVEDVVAEIQERAAGMDAQLDRILIWRASCEASYKDVFKAFKFLQKIGDQLPAHLAEVDDFSSYWSVEKGKIDECMVGMEELCDLYENFLAAYDGMIVEAARRKGVRKRMEKIVQEAQTQLDQLYQDDLTEREHFRAEQGDYLPSDIWHGLDVLPSQFAFHRSNDEGLDSIPDLPKETVASALKRLKAAHGMGEAGER
ncbi:autophagy protein 17 [Lithohypha guttulata]|uniref:Autophagy-related protein 17 n=1 Tax=Lithohypha guttulata TaxID=1690604 RepID=A0AAN7Y542_9EURO|nr:autophagy protein 17 [Lithohypha guttulata]